MNMKAKAPPMPSLEALEKVLECTAALAAKDSVAEKLETLAHANRIQAQCEDMVELLKQAEHEASEAQAHVELRQTNSMQGKETPPYQPLSMRVSPEALEEQLDELADEVASLASEVTLDIAISDKEEILTAYSAKAHETQPLDADELSTLEGDSLPSLLNLALLQQGGVVSDSLVLNADPINHPQYAELIKAAKQAGSARQRIDKALDTFGKVLEERGVNVKVDSTYDYKQIQASKAQPEEKATKAAKVEAAKPKTQVEQPKAEQRRGAPGSKG